RRLPRAGRARGGGAWWLLRELCGDEEIGHAGLEPLRAPDRQRVDEAQLRQSIRNDGERAADQLAELPRALLVDANRLREREIDRGTVPLRELERAGIVAARHGRAAAGPASLVCHEELVGRAGIIG